MDPHKQQLSTMDPKLKAAYDQVMNTPIKTAVLQEPTPSPKPNPSSPDHPDSIGNHIGVQSGQNPPVASPFTPPPQVKTIPSSGTVHIGYGAKPAGTKIILEKKKLGIPPAVYIVGCVVFFIFYAIFWIKVFGVKIPYLP